jgi:hypothetical protein
MSAVLSTFPWATDFLSKDINGILTNGIFAVRVGYGHMLLPF